MASVMTTVFAKAERPAPTWQISVPIKATAVSAQASAHTKQTAAAFLTFKSMDGQITVTDNGY